MSRGPVRGGGQLCPKCGWLALAALLTPAPHLAQALAGEAAAPASFTYMAMAGAMSDYVYRGISLRDEKPAPFLYLSASYGSFYINGFLVGVELGDDALGRGLGNIEVDVTAGATYTIGKADFDAGIRCSFYPNGRDLIVGTLQEAERDFVEPFIGATLRMTEEASLSASVSWTPDFYYETGEIITVEGQAAYVLPEISGIHSKLTAALGRAASENPDAVSPGDGYTYWNAGIEATVERLIFDLRYWDTDVKNADGYDQRFVVSVAISFE